MRQEQLISFFRHVAAHQSTHGIQHAFRFKTILSDRKKGYLLPAEYRASAGANPTTATTSTPVQPETIEIQPATVVRFPLQ